MVLLLSVIGFIYKGSYPTAELLAATVSILTLGALQIGFKRQGDAPAALNSLDREVLLAIVEMSERLSVADFTYSIKAHRESAFKLLADNLNHTALIMDEMFSRVSQHTDELETAFQALRNNSTRTSSVAKNISSIMHEVAKGAEAQVRGAVESAKAIEELSTGVQRISESSNEMFESSQETSQIAAEGGDYIQNAIALIDRASQTVLQTSSAMNELNGRTQFIGKIIDTIQEISTQTNLLSLNASIEAAHAGDKGRGFAVVASEIRKLAEQTKMCSEEVRKSVLEVQAHSKVVDQYVASGIEVVEKGKTKIMEAGDVFHQIIQGISAMVGQIQAISVSLEHMSAGSQQVSATVHEFAKIAVDAGEFAGNVATASEEQLIAMKEVADSSIAMGKLVFDMRDILQQFKM
jgi:methyl-accepting chemotaxis protein